MHQTNIRALFEKSFPELETSILPAFSGRENVYRSPELLDIVVWNVVVSYCVSLLANASFHFALLIDKKREESVRLTKTELAEMDQELSQQFEIPAIVDESFIVARLQGTFREFGVDEENSTNLAKSAFGILTKHILDGPEKHQQET